MNFVKLSIAAGGGIVPENLMSEQSDKNTNILIGLGGTGKDCLKTIKRDIYTRLKSDDPESPIRTYKNVSFLCFDSDKSGIEKTDENYKDDVGNLAPQEFCWIGCKAISAFIEDDSLKNNPAYTWLKSPATEPAGKSVNVTDAKMGAGGVRQAGRALLFNNVSEVKNRITNLIINAKKGMPGATVKIHLFTGIGGGTGAGSFLDICYLIRHIASENKWADLQVFGYFFLPDVNLSNEHLGEAAREAIKCTGYAAMKEIDYCMNFSNNGDKWNQFYGGFTITSSEKPVDYAFLVTAQDANGIIQPEPYKYAMNVVSNFVMDSLTKQTTAMTVDSIISNIPTLISHVTPKEHGGNYGYCVIGASCAYMPFSDITTYLVSKLFSKFNKIEDNLPSANDIAEFGKKNKLNYEGIMRELRRSVPAVRMYDVDLDTLYDQAQACTTNSQYPAILDKMYQDDESRIVGVLEANKKALTEPLDRGLVIKEGSAASLINRIFQELAQYSRNLDMGPFYAGAFLHTVKEKDITNAIDGMIAENNRRLRLADGNLELREKEYGDALVKFKNSHFGNKKRCGKALIGAFHARCVQESETWTLKNMSEVLTQFKRQVSDLYSGYFSRMESLFRDLAGVFKNNLDAFDGNIVADDEFAVKIISVNDPSLKIILNDSVEAMRKEDVFSSFIDCLQSNDVWLSQDEDKTVALINRHFVEELKEYREKTTESYLEVKFNTDNPTELQNRIYNEIILPVSEKAAPLFWQTANYRIANASPTGYCSVPSMSPMITNAANTYIANLSSGGDKYTLVPQEDPGRISFLQMRCGVPLFGYQGIYSYSRAEGHVGRYIYEASSRDERNWGVSYDLIPLSCIGDSAKTDRIKYKETIIKKAKEFGVFGSRSVGESQDKEFYINVIDMTENASTIDALKHQADKGNSQTIIKFLSEILSSDAITHITSNLENGIDAVFTSEFDKLIKSSFKILSEKFVPAVGTNGYEDLCADDVVFSYKVLFDAAEANALAAENRYNAIKLAISKLVNDLATSNLASSFVSALCCNVITTTDNYTFKSYSKNQYGLLEETQLTSIDSKPYGEYLPLYSAYVAFSTLDPDVRKSITDEIKNKKMSAPNEIIDATNRVKTMFSDVNNVNSSSKMIQRTKTSFAHQADVIMKFISDFSNELTNI